MTAYKYVGDGSFVTGVPARDLEGDEDLAAVARWEEKEGKKLEASGLYELAKEPKGGRAATVED